MEEAKINISELKNEGGDVIKNLTTYLREKTGAQVETETDNIIVKGETATMSRTYLRVLLRKFLHKNELRDYFRVISGKEKTLVIKGRETREEE